MTLLPSGAQLPVVTQLVVGPHKPTSRPYWNLYWHFIGISRNFILFRSYADNHSCLRSMAVLFPEEVFLSSRLPGYLSIRAVMLPCTVKVSVEVHKENKTTQTIGNYHTRGTVSILHLCTWLQYSQKLGNGTHQQMNGERKYEIYTNYIYIYTKEFYWVVKKMKLLHL